MPAGSADEKIAKGILAGKGIKLKLIKKSPLLEMAMENIRAGLALEKNTAAGKQKKEKEAADAVLELKTALEMGEEPALIEAVDISHHAGGEMTGSVVVFRNGTPCLLYTSPSPRDRTRSRMPSSA